MCNCGKRRTQLQQPSRPLNKIVEAQIHQPVTNKEPILFQYTGSRTLTVTGSVTRKTYRFNFPGAMTHIDARDAPAMMAVPVLKRV